MILQRSLIVQDLSKSVQNSAIQLALVKRNIPLFPFIYTYIISYLTIELFIKISIVLVSSYRDNTIIHFIPFSLGCNMFPLTIACLFIRWRQDEFFIPTYAPYIHLPYLWKLNLFLYIYGVLELIMGWFLLLWLIINLIVAYYLAIFIKKCIDRLVTPTYEPHALSYDSDNFLATTGYIKAISLLDQSSLVMVQNFTLMITGVVNSSNNVATMIIMTQWFQTLITKPLYSLVNTLFADCVIKISELCTTYGGFEAHSLESSNSVSSIFKKLATNFRSVVSVKLIYDEICTLVTLVLATGLLDKSAFPVTHSRLIAFAKLIKPAQHGAKSLGDLLVTTSTKILAGASSFFGLDIMPDITNLELDYVDITSISNSYMSGSLLINYPNFNRSNIIPRLTHLESKYKVLLSSLPPPINVYEKTILTSKLLSLRTLLDSVNIKLQSEAYTRAAFGVIITGSSCIGKSSLVSLIISSIGNTQGFPTAAINIANVSECSGDKYDSLFTSSTTAVIYDDANSSKTQDSNKVVKYAIGCVNNIKYTPTKAELELKGKVSFEPQIVIITSNTPDCGVSLVAKNELAVKRRFYHIVPTLKDKYCTAGMLDPYKVSLDPNNNMDLWHIDVFQYEADPTRPNCAVMKAIKTKIGFPETLVVLNDLARAHYAHQTTVVDRLSNADKVKFCIHGSFPHSCPLCNPVVEVQSSNGTIMDEHSMSLTPDIDFSYISSTRFKVVDYLSHTLIYGILIPVLIRKYKGKSNVQYNLAKLMSPAYLFMLISSYVYPYNASLMLLLIGLCVIHSSISYFISAQKDYYDFMKSLSMPVKFKQCLQEVDSSRVRVGLTVCSAGAVALIIFKAYKSYELYKYAGHSSNDLYFVDKEYDDDPPPNPWEKARLSLTPITDVSNASPRVFMDVARKYGGIIRRAAGNADITTSIKDHTGGTVCRRCWYQHINSNAIITNTHSLLLAEKMYFPEHNNSVSINDHTTIDLGDDVSMVHYTGGGTRRDLVPLFSNTPPVVGTLLDVYFPDGVVHTMIKDIQHVTTNSSSFKGILYNAQSEPGKCGSFIVAPSCKSIYGIHSAGVPSSTLSAGSMITRDRIETALSVLNSRFNNLVPLSDLSMTAHGLIINSKSSEPPVVDDFKPSNICNFVTVGMQVKFHGSFPIGSEQGPRYSSSNFTKLSSSDILSRLGHPTNEFIPDLSVNNSRLMYQRLVEKLNNKPIGFDSSLINMGVGVILKKFLSLPTNDINPVSVVVATNGNPKAKGMGALNMRTSAGPYFGGSKLSHSSNNPKEDGSNFYTFNSAIMDSMSDIWDDMKTGYVTRSAACTTIFKDEPRCCDALGNVKDSRPISVFPVSVTLVNRQLFLSVQRWFAINMLTTGVAVGVNPYSRDWHDMHDKLSSMGSKVFDADYGSFDTTMNLGVIQGAFSIFYKLCESSGNYSPDQLSAIKVILTENVNPIMVINGNMFSSLGGNTTGCPMTTHLNCMVNLLYQVMAFLMLRPDSSWDFYEHVCTFMYGDDLVSSCSDEASLFYNQVSISRIMTGVGLKYTNARKESATLEHSRLEDVQFLKRSFFQHPDLGVVVGPLAVESIYGCLHYAPISSLVSPRSEPIHIAQLLDSCACEFFYHGRDVYETNLRVLRQVSLDLNISTLTTFSSISYDSRVDDWRKIYP